MSDTVIFFWNPHFRLSFPSPLCFDMLQGSDVVFPTSASQAEVASSNAAPQRSQLLPRLLIFLLSLIDQMIYLVCSPHQSFTDYFAGSISRRASPRIQTSSLTLELRIRYCWCVWIRASSVFCGRIFTDDLVQAFAVFACSGFIAFVIAFGITSQWWIQNPNTAEMRKIATVYFFSGLFC
jgi:hypothetical protein